LIPFLRFPSLLWRVDQRKVNPMPLSVFGSIVLKPLYVCTVFDRNISSVLAVTTALLRTWEMSCAFSAPRLWNPTKSLSTRVLLCVAPFRCLVFCRDVCFGSRPLLFSLLFTPRSTLSWYSSNIMAYGLREKGTSLACSHLVLVSLHDDWIESHKPWCLLRMS
jgi:hypothetical protein